MGIEDVGPSTRGEDEGTFELTCESAGANPAVNHIWLKRVKRRDQNGAETKGTELIQIPTEDVVVTNEMEQK